METSLKILITGPESSGKTMLANHLKVYLNGFLVNEYAREYFRKKGLAYDSDDILEIAKEQLTRIQKAFNQHDIIICDTGPLVLNIWWDEKANAEKPQWLAECMQKHSFDVVLLCKPDIPWEPDPLRENPNDRDRLFDCYYQQLRDAKIKFHVMEGNKEKRLRDALFAIQQCVRARKKDKTSVTN